MGVEHLPALVHVNVGGQLMGAAQGWNPTEWRDVVDKLATVMKWTRPTFPLPGDPSPYTGTPALP